ncbi:hypothetical protein PUR71_12745 [Streptomyces sp. SP17BM10]|nr:hypothetical protein [Streptomyces sp. SP17BM10]MEE1783767.1 hypothetical protein [Streptomyces sp. SP17BM10]
MDFEIRAAPAGTAVSISATTGFSPAADCKSATVGRAACSATRPG